MVRILWLILIQLSLNLAAIQSQAQCDPKKIQALIAQELKPIRQFTESWLPQSRVFADDLIEDFVQKRAFSDRVTVHFEYGFNGLKGVNEINKDLGTAISNLGQQNLKAALEDLLKQYPELQKLYKIHYYNDFKTIRLGFEPKDPTKVWKDSQWNSFFSKLSEKANEKNKIALSSEAFKDLNTKVNVNEWFLSGAGRSLDESALLARQCRSVTCANGFSGFQTDTSNQLISRANQLRKDFANQRDSLEGQARVLKIAGSIFEQGRVSPQILDVVKKFKGEPEALARELKYVTGFKGSEKQLVALSKGLKDYFELVDAFQPAVLSVKREVLALPGRGGISADVKGLGILNADETQKALIGSEKGSINQLLSFARQGERNATSQFNDTKKNFENLLQQKLGMKVKCSGDDCLSSLPNQALMTQAQRDTFVQSVLDQNLQNKFRFTLLPDTPAATQLSSNLENIEKGVVAGVSQRLRTEFSAAELSQISYFIDGSKGKNQVSLIIGFSKDAPPSLVAKVQKYQSQIVGEFRASSLKNFPGSVVNPTVRMVKGK